MKTPKFWYRKTGPSALMLTPLGQLYRTAGLLRHAFVNPYKAGVPVLCVGNIVAGGAGKTPTAITLARLLIQKGERPVFVTRGYGGSQKGPVRVDLKLHTSRDVGDEAVLLAQIAPCWIGRNRAAAIQCAETEKPTHIILDDGLQNPKIAPDINLLVVDGAVGFGNKLLIPAGPLRETLHDVFSRIAAIVMIGADVQRVATCLGKPVLQAHLKPLLAGDLTKGTPILAFAGIGRPEKFYNSCREAGLNVVETRDFADHYIFTDEDLQSLAATAKQKEIKLVTTTKDWVRLPDPFRRDVGILDVQLVFENEGDVLNLIQSSTTAPCDPS